MFKKAKSVLLKPLVKTIIITVFTTVISVLIGMMGSWNVAQPYFVTKLVVLIVVVILYIRILTGYTTAEVNGRRTVEEQERQINAFTDLAVNMIAACEMNAADINQCIHHVNETHSIDLNIWNFKKSSRTLCQQIYGSVCQLGNSKNYAVAYVALDEKNTEKDVVKMIAYANKTSRSPSIYDRPRHFGDAHKRDESYLDLKLFSRAHAELNGATNNMILWGSDEVASAFRYPTQGDMARNQGRYHIYVGIPIFCDKKMVGLLEVVGMDETKLGCLTKQELEEMADKLLVPYANLFLLLHKMEKALLAGVS